jgi:hypothetical protein
MLANDLVSLFITPLNRTGLPYMVTGSVAAMLYGEPRMTHDIDLVVELKTDRINKLLNEFPSEEFYLPPVEIIGVEIARHQRGHLNIIHHATGYKADVYIQGGDNLHAWGMEKKRTMIINNEEIHIAPAEYVILRKLEYYREGGYQKHLLDIEAMVRVGGGDISFHSIEEWVLKLSLDKEWAEVKNRMSTC